MTEQIRCHKCGKSFGSSSELREHERNCKGGSRKSATTKGTRAAAFVAAFFFCIARFF
jgi:Zinc finger, C2H2 type